MSTEFFIEQLLQSQIKTNIVKKYFYAWQTIMINRCKVASLAYVDLFSGPGAYSENEPSTPIEIIQTCLNNTELVSKIKLLFNDMNQGFTEALEENISNLPNIETLHHTPVIVNSEVDEYFLHEVRDLGTIPKLSFVDPFGYKGVSTNLINGLVQDFGSDSILFFNYNRVQAAITNPKVDSHMKALFGHVRHETMKETVKNIDKDVKEAYIVEMFAQSLSNHGQNIILPFKFTHEEKNTTSHYLIHITKHKLGHKIMKDIMATESTLKEDGFASFSYIPVKHLQNRKPVQLSILDCYDGEMDILKKRIKEKYSGKIMKLIELFDEDNIGTNYILKNYKDAVRLLESEGAIRVYPPAEKRRKYKGEVSVADHVEIHL